MKRKDSSDKNAKQQSNLGAFMKGTVWAILLSLFAVCILACLITYGSFPESYIGPAIIVIIALSACASGAISAKGAQCRGILSGLIAGAMLFLIYYAVGALSGAKMQGFSAVVFYMIASILCGMIGGVLGVNKKGVRRKK